MSQLGDFSRQRARRPYWLLLALALFVAGQIAAVSHWHNDGATLDVDCALCALSSATGAAVVSDPLVVVSLALATFIFIEIARTCSVRRAFAYDSRAPPLYS